jgi:Zn-dependent peptidase ImmA (M78 family)
VRRARERLIAERLLREAGVFEPPVPIEAIVRSQSIQIVKRRFDDETSGFVHVDPTTKSAIIGLNISHSKTRQRFTLAHELGHFSLHKNSDGLMYVDDRDFFVRFRNPHSSGGSDREEREANAFAAEILMPKDFLERDIETVGDELSLSAEHTFIAELAARYGVSRQALSFRLINLGLIDPAAFH